METNETENATGYLIERRHLVSEFLLENYDVEYLKSEGARIEAVDGAFYAIITVDVIKPNAPVLVASENLSVALFEEDIFEANFDQILIEAKTAWAALRAVKKEMEDTDFASLTEDFDGQGLVFERDEEFGDIIVDYEDTSVGYEKGSASLPSSKETAFDIEEARAIARRKIEERAKLASTVGRTPDDRMFDVISDGMYNEISRSLVSTDVGASHPGVNIMNEPRTFQFDKNGMFLVSYDGRIVRDVIPAETPKHLSEVRSYYNEYGICVIKDDRDGYWVGPHTDHLPADREGWKQAARAKWEISIRDADKTAEKLKLARTRPRGRLAQSGVQERSPVRAATAS